MKTSCEGLYVVGLKNDDLDFQDGMTSAYRLRKMSPGPQKEDGSKSTHGPVSGLKEGANKSQPTIGLGRVTNEPREQRGTMGPTAEDELGWRPPPS